MLYLYIRPWKCDFFQTALSKSVLSFEIFIFAGNYQKPFNWNKQHSVLHLLASHSWFFPGVFLGRQLGLVSLPLIFTAGRRRGWRERYNVLKLLSTQGWNPQVSTKPLTTCCCSMRISVGKMFSLEEPPCVLGFGVICRRRGQLCLQAPWRLRWFLTTLLLPVPS